MTNNQEYFQELVNEGHSAAWDQDWERAEQAYRRALVEIPDQPGALMNLGLALFQQHKYDESLACYQRTARITPTDPIPYERISVIFEQQGKLKETIQVTNQAAELFLRNRDIDKAIECWLHVSSLDPTNQTACGRLGLVYEKMGHREKAVQQYLVLAGLAQRAGDQTRAGQIVEHALQILPESTEAHEARSALRSNRPIPVPFQTRSESGLLRESDLRVVPAAAEKVKETDPVAGARQEAIAQLAALLFDQAGGMDSGANSRTGLHSPGGDTGDFIPIDRDRNRITLHIGQAIDSQGKGDDNQATAELERAVEAGLAYPAAFFLLGLFVSARDPEKSREYLVQAARSQAFSLAARLLISKIELDCGNYHAAAVAALQALKSADAATLPAGQTDEVERLYEPAIDAQSQRTEAEQRKLVSVVMELVMREDWKEQLRSTRTQLTAQRVQQGQVSLADGLFEIGDSQVAAAMPIIQQLANQKMPRSAMEEAFYALQYAPAYLPLHTLMGELLVMMGDLQGAVVKYKLTAELYHLRGETGLAVEMLNRIIRIDLMDMDSRKRLCDLLMSQGNLDEVIQQYINMAEIHYQLSDLVNARSVLSTALELIGQQKTTKPWEVDLLVRIADIDLQKLDLRQALRSYEKIRSLDPDHIGARSNIVNINLRLQQVKAAMDEVVEFVAGLEKTGRNEKATEFLTNMIEENPEVSDLYRLLADLYIRAGRVDQAVARLDALADRMNLTSNKTEAVNALQAIIQLAPPNAADYQAALKQIQEQ